MMWEKISVYKPWEWYLVNIWSNIITLWLNSHYSPLILSFKKVSHALPIFLASLHPTSLLWCPNRSSMNAVAFPLIRFSGLLQAALLWGGGCAAHHPSAALQLRLRPAGQRFGGPERRLSPSPLPPTPLPALPGPRAGPQHPHLFPEFRLHQLLLRVVLPHLPLQHLLLCAGDGWHVRQQPLVHAQRGRASLRLRPTLPGASGHGARGGTRRRPRAETSLLWQRQAPGVCSAPLPVPPSTPLSPPPLPPHPAVLPPSRPSPRPHRPARCHRSEGDGGRLLSPAVFVPPKRGGRVGQTGAKKTGGGGGGRGRGWRGPLPAQAPDGWLRHRGVPLPGEEGGAGGGRGAAEVQRGNAEGGGRARPAAW